MAKFTINSTTEIESAPTVILDGKQHQRQYNYHSCKNYEQGMEVTVGDIITVAYSYVTEDVTICSFCYHGWYRRQVAFHPIFAFPFLFYSVKGNSWQPSSGSRDQILLGQSLDLIFCVNYQKNQEPLLYPSSPRNATTHLCSSHERQILPVKTPWFVTANTKSSEQLPFQSLRQRVIQNSICCT